MIGLDVMGRNLVPNMADHGDAAAGYDKDQAKIEALRQESKERDVCGAENIQEFARLLPRPRAVMMLVPAGPPVNSVIGELLPHLEKGDLFVGVGNSCFCKITICVPTTCPRKAFNSSEWACLEARTARATARASCPWTYNPDFSSNLC